MMFIQLIFHLQTTLFFKQIKALRHGISHHNSERSIPVESEHKSHTTACPSPSQLVFPDPKFDSPPFPPSPFPFQTMFFTGPILYLPNLVNKITLGER